VYLVTYKNYDHLDWLAITLGAQKDIKLGHEVTWTPQYNISLMKPWFKANFRLVSARTFANVALTSNSQAMTFSMEASIASRSTVIA